MSIGEYLKSIFSLEGKTILISGATGGIGSAISRGLAAAGAETALCARNQQKCRELADEIAAHGGAATAHALDISDLDSIHRCVDEVMQRYGKIVALGLGVIYTMLLAVFHKASVRKSNADATGKNPQSFREVVLNSWIARGLEIALPALLITGMGGAFAAVIKAAPAINDLAGLIEQSGVPGLLIPFLIGAIMFTAVGSMTTGGMTAAGVVGPMMVTLGLSPISTVLAIGAGTMIFNHVNNSGFWVISRFFNLDLKQGLKYITLPDFVAGIFCFVMICGAAAVGLF